MPGRTEYRAEAADVAVTPRTFGSDYCNTLGPDVVPDGNQLSGLLIYRKEYTRLMLQHSDWDDSVQSTTPYADQLFAERLRHALTVSRRREHAWASITHLMWESQSKRDPSTILDNPTLFYRSSRMHWHIKRSINARLVGMTNMHKQIMEVWKPVLLDLLSHPQPTAKDWKELTEKGEKQTRRIEEYYPHMVTQMDNLGCIVLQNQDGTQTVLPKKITRKSGNDKRTKKITTLYSSPRLNTGGFAMRIFADESYLKRQRQFWMNTLAILSGWLSKGHKIRPEKEWLVHHIVNNDMALHVLFDDISTECECRWFENLARKVGSQPPFKRNARRGELRCRTARVYIMEGTDAQVYVMQQSPDAKQADLHHSGQIVVTPEMYVLNVMGMVKLEPPGMAAMRCMDEGAMGIIHAPDVFTMNDAEGAVAELEDFAKNFGVDIMPDGLAPYMIPSTKMRERIYDTALESALALLNSEYEGCWNMVCSALARRPYLTGGHGGDA